MPECVFCDIVAGERSAHRLHEDERTLAFLDAAPAAPGHALVVPKPHRETLTEVEPDLAVDLFRSVRRVASAVESALDPDGLNVVQSNGEAAGQDVFHAHVHVVPRYGDDDVTLAWSPGDPPGESDRDIAAEIRDAL
ncbi:HIT family protein (plasmid) [Halorussus salilacus]|uniref:HIT family protein n=1 Tax=Halorussus salilacus TaxID=2953750 RepID=UPI0020A0F9DD|nr:HIT family protein [Halorussus salilacus]USZ69980.1 HIT family protein [Halorussus salilacus]